MVSKGVMDIQLLLQITEPYEAGNDTSSINNMYNLKLPGILIHITNGFREHGGGPELVAHSFTSLTHALLAAVSLVHPCKVKYYDSINT